MRRLREYLTTYGLLLTLAVMILAWTALALVLLTPLPARRRRALARYTMMAGFRLFSRLLTLTGAYRLDLGALDRLPREPALILAPNHPSAFDAILLLTRHPDLACILKPGLLGNPLLGAGARLAGYIRSDPPRRMIKDAVAQLRRGSSVLLFPEGTRTRCSPINPLMGGVAAIARHADAPIQVLLIETDSPYLGKGWPFFKVPRLPIEYRVRLGRRFEPPSDAAECMRSLEREYRTQLAAAPQRAWLGEPARCAPGTPAAHSAQGPQEPPAGARSSTHLVLIPSYNPGTKVFETVRAARAQWAPVWVVVDGSTDGTAEALAALSAADPQLTVLRRARNGGKGAALLDGLTEALRRGYTHALTMDSDGQHPAERIGAFMQASRAHPEAMILGRPLFDASAPAVRVRGRRLSNWWANLETLGAGIEDSLCGFRVYPIAPLVRLMLQHPHAMRRFDFDVEAAVRLCWAGVPALNLPAPVRYFSAEQGGVSHFRYVRDNILLTSMHFRLFFGFLVRLPRLARAPPAGR